MQSSRQLPSSNDFNAGKLLAGLALLGVVGFLLVQGFLLLRDGNLPKLANAAVAIVWGVGGVAVLYYTLNLMVESLAQKTRMALQPFVFIGPAALILVWFFIIPTIRTAILSLYDRDGEIFIGIQNYITTFTDREMLLAVRNNLLWMVFGTTFCVGMGLLVAVLADRSRMENLVKSIIFLPMAISFVGAGVIWKFIFYYAPEGAPQIGLLNSIVTSFGGQPQAWLALIQPWNNLFLIVVLIWMQTGFCMVTFSAALKGVPEELIEAGRIDGASERRIFFGITIPYIQGTIVTVTTTILIFTLKIFDVVQAMTGGQFGTDVIGTQFYRQLFANRNLGAGSAIAVVLLVATIPIMVYNLRQMARQKTM
ncbi:MAG: sugar ABC transporter permease [Thermoflexales bacterium]